MDKDAFTGGVDPGGLWTKNDIRILLCYILSSVDAPLSAGDISGIMQGRGLANYFETGDALAGLERLGHIRGTPEGYVIEPTGREIAESLDTGLPLAVRDKALEAAVSLLARARAKRENRVEIQDLENGCRVRCVISGGSSDLMELSLYVPDRAQARVIEEHFYEDPQGVYQLLLAVLTGDRELAREYFQGNR